MAPPRRRTAMRRTLLNITLLTCAIAFASSGDHGQIHKSAVAKKERGGLDGEVVSAKGAPVAGAQILWQASDGETPHVLHSDAQGRFHIEPLRTGSYDLRASASGTWSEWEHNVFVRPGNDTIVTLRLTFKEAPVAAGIELKGTMRVWDAPVP